MCEAKFNVHLLTIMDCPPSTVVEQAADIRPNLGRWRAVSQLGQGEDAAEGYFLDIFGGAFFCNNDRSEIFDIFVGAFDIYLRYLRERWCSLGMFEIFDI